MHVKKSGIAALPDSLGKLTKLEVLKISECVGLAALPASLINLSNLLALEISDCALIAALPAGYGALTKLRHLDFSGCDDLADVLYDDPVVDELEARGCGMFGPGFEIEPAGYDPRATPTHTHTQCQTAQFICAQPPLTAWYRVLLPSTGMTLSRRR